MFVTFEGIDGAGKTTILEQIAQELASKNIPYCQTREPGGSSLGVALRKQVLYGVESIHPKAELFLFLADRAQHLAEVIRPALAAKKIVLCDRYVDSTLAYQGYGRGMDLAELRLLNELATQNLQPDLTLLFDLDVLFGLQRAQKRNSLESHNLGADRFDQETVDFHTRVRAGYLEEAKLHPKRYVQIDASQPVEQVLAACRKILWQRLDLE